MTKWNKFWDSYESAMQSSNALTKVDKFNYLSPNLLEAEESALCAMQGLNLANSNCDDAVKILRDRFGRPQQVIAAHIDKILKI